ncbi:MAG: hypothetical protein R3Y55_00025 [Rikenellaceae bacterium]
MNRVFTSIVLTLGLISSAAAQSMSSVSQPQDPNEVIVLSSYVDGNYNVEQLLVMESSPSNNEFVVRYKINLTKLISTYDNNSTEIAGLHNFIESIQGDSLKRVTNFDIIGYASPDGPAALNKRLASERANDFNRFLEADYSMKEFPHTISSIPYQWIDTKQAIQSSTVPNKTEVLSIIQSSGTQSEIQAQLEAHPAAWEYIKSNILPPMRSVELHVKYNSWKVVENRTLIEEIVPATPSVGANGKMRGDRRAEECEIDSCYDPCTDDYINCVLVEMPEAALDFDCGCQEERIKYKGKRHGAKLKESGAEGSAKIKEKSKKDRWWRNE